ncbi:urease accessory protein UreH [Paenibacillus macquariensis subsp. defensor]|uniref:Nickel/cobalt efflux system n=1 Tax=Paenibacillus macquariensis TaxID=948756 RepID=A0ABY1K3G0_9BACL|nr:sulfite exporter TauE/SafE family protein [Paenibacillus macquariensis]MEC0090377.1 sulfite exporter TauE/SafE family protein [Paenibacillus macquariensis]OAB33152.1 urease accessory protein UreH [Paenibacillus macquariensis subsp. defensor]OAB39730.1 urease accessory protein UreH [Paenibacillus macquariensis subsp. macquariensis]SIR20199.1 Cytochrome C biogenesis protein transmembrane region [Paenibacillus macquariensis]
MELGLLSILGIGFILGIKHAIEPDHVIAVSTIASQSKNLFRSTLAGVFWGIGHTATLFLVGLVLILTKNAISDTWASSLEFAVGIMLVYLGISSLLLIRKKHEHKSPNLSVLRNKASYMKSLIIGMIHGLAGSAAMVLLTMSTVSTVWDGAIYILCFGLGTIAGMLFFTTILGIPFVLSANNMSVNLTLTSITGTVSIVFGLYYMYNLGITEGLFGLWMG